MKYNIISDSNNDELKILEKEINELSEQILTKKQEINSIKAQIDKIEQNRINSQRERNELYNKIQNMRYDIDSLSLTIDEKKRKLNDLYTKRSKKQKELENKLLINLSESINKINTDMINLKIDYASINKDNRSWGGLLGFFGISKNHTIKHYNLKEVFFDQNWIYPYLSEHLTQTCMSFYENSANKSYSIPFSEFILNFALSGGDIMAKEIKTKLEKINEQIESIGKLKMAEIKDLRELYAELGKMNNKLAMELLFDYVITIERFIKDNYNAGEFDLDNLVDEFLDPLITSILISDFPINNHFGYGIIMNREEMKDKISIYTFLDHKITIEYNNPKYKTFLSLMSYAYNKKAYVPIILDDVQNHILHIYHRIVEKPADILSGMEKIYKETWKTIKKKSDSNMDKKPIKKALEILKEINGLIELEDYNELEYELKKGDLEYADSLILEIIKKEKAHKKLNLPVDKDVINKLSEISDLIEDLY